jgi:uncharacterized lipoprotein YehR (DUF1307 family)
MKKTKVFFLLVILFLVTLLLCGCGKIEKLSCTLIQNKNNMEFLFTYNNALKEVNLNYNIDVSEYNNEQREIIKKQDFCSTLKTTMSTYANYFTSCNQDIDSEYLRVKSTLDAEKLLENFSDELKTIDGMKANLEESGYTCTIK